MGGLCVVLHARIARSKALMGLVLCATKEKESGAVAQPTVWLYVRISVPSLASSTHEAAISANVCPRAAAL